MKLLIVDDEPNIRSIIAKYCKYENYETIEAKNGYQAIEACKKNNFDIIIMDIMMPEMDGFTAVKKIKEFHDVPVIMLSARGEEYDKIHGFELGIDDYMVKPFSPRELIMRVQAIAKRTLDTNPNNYIMKELNIDFDGRIVKIANEEIYLTPKEYDLLFYLVRNKSKAMSREKILNIVWGYDFFGEDRTIDTHIKSLRKALGDYGKYIKTIRSIGYRFDEEV